MARPGTQRKGRSEVDPILTIMKRISPVAPLSLMILLLATLVVPAQRVVPSPEDPVRQLGVALRAIGSDGRALYITAHPDDEDNRLLAWLGLGRGMACTLFTQTRGEGGQNAIGDELFEALGVLRMKELAAAHRLDGAQQRFGRAFEFGYSFSVEETFEKWGREHALRDVVQVIREVRPHVIFTMPREATVGGQHHQATARLGEEAFEVAASDRWPELGAPWAASRIFEQLWTAPAEDRIFVTPPVDRYDPLLGTTYRDLGYRARSMHKCQETGQVLERDPGLRARRFGLVASRGPEVSGGEDPFEGLDVGPDPDEIWGAEGMPDPTRPAAVRARLLALRESLPEHHRAKIDRALALATPVLLEGRTPRAEVVAGESIKVRFILQNRSALDLETVSVRLVTRFAEPRTIWTGSVAAGARQEESISWSVPEDAPATLVRLDRGWDAPDRYGDEVDPLLPPISCAELEVRSMVAGVPVLLARVPVVHRVTDQRFPSVREYGLAIRPRVEARFLDPVTVAPRGSTRGITDARIRIGVTVRGSGDAGSSASDTAIEDPGELMLEGRARGDERWVAWARWPMPTTSTEFVAPAPLRPEDVAGKDAVYQLRLVRLLSNGRSEALEASRAVNYPHVHRTYLAIPARAHLVSFACELPPRGRTVGYVEGTGDLLDEMLEQAGVSVHRLDAADLFEGDLGRFESILVGVRAYRIREDLAKAKPRLEEWMRSGGHLIVQYNKNGEMNSGTGGRGGSPHTPFPARVTRNRVTDETSPIRIAVEDHTLLSRPHRIGDRDWVGWVQERSTYHLEDKGEPFERLLILADPFPLNAGDKDGALVTAPVGTGRWTYCGLTLFRQVPAGVPGAWRLLANLLAGS